MRYAAKARFHYLCRQGCKQTNGRSKQCQRVAAPDLDAQISALILEVVSPAGVDAAIEAEAILTQQRQSRRRILADQVEQTRYEAERAFRQYDRTDPDNPLVAGELERRWEQSLACQSDAEASLTAFDEHRRVSLDSVEIQALRQLGGELAQIWLAPAAAVEPKKQIARLLIARIIIGPSSGDILPVVVHWTGGQLSEHQLAITGRPSSVASCDALSAVQSLHKIADDASLAQILNSSRIKADTDATASWTEAGVSALRQRHGIAVFSEEAKHANGHLTQEEAATALGISAMSVHRLIRGGVLKAEQASEGLPCIVQATDLASPSVQRAVQAIKASRGPQCDRAHPDQPFLWSEKAEASQ